jgi:hypothetical protein
MLLLSSNANRACHPSSSNTAAEVLLWCSMGPNKQNMCSNHTPLTFLMSDLKPYRAWAAAKGECSYMWVLLPSNLAVAVLC